MRPCRRPKSTLYSALNLRGAASFHLPPRKRPTMFPIELERIGAPLSANSNPESRMRPPGTLSFEKDHFHLDTKPRLGSMGEQNNYRVHLPTASMCRAGLSTTASVHSAIPLKNQELSSSLPSTRLAPRSP